MTRGAIAIVIGVAVFALLARFVLTTSNEVSASTASIYPVDIAVGQELYVQYCAACHGVNLEGQANWRSAGPDGRLPAPPHDKSGHTWHHPDSVLFTYTRLGGQETMAEQGIEFDSSMPGFGDVLSDEEIWNILAYIKSTWPERERKVQAERTASDLALQGE